jgi:hypothetical protein
MFLVYGGCEEELDVKVYTNATFDTDPDDSKSQSGYVFMVKQRRGELEEHQANYGCSVYNVIGVYSCFRAGNEGLFLSMQDPMILCCDNTCVMTLRFQVHSVVSAEYFLHKGDSRV